MLLYDEPFLQSSAIVTVILVFLSFHQFDSLWPLSKSKYSEVRCVSNLFFYIYVIPEKKLNNNGNQKNYTERLEKSFLLLFGLVWIFYYDVHTILYVGFRRYILTRVTVVSKCVNELVAMSNSVSECGKGWLMEMICILKWRDLPLKRLCENLCICWQFWF